MSTGALALLSSVSELFACLVPQRQFVLPTEKAVVFTKGKTPRVMHNTAFWYWPLFTEVRIFDIADKPHFLTSHKITTLDGKVICMDIIAMTRVVDALKAGLTTNASKEEEDQEEDVIRVNVNLALARWSAGLTEKAILDRFHFRDGSLLEMANERLGYFGIKVTEVDMVEFAVSDYVITHFGIRETE